MRESLIKTNVSFTDVKKEVFDHILAVARLPLDPEEYEKILKDINSILSLTNILDELSFKNSCEQETSNTLREDKVEPFGEDLTVVFPKKKGNLLEVPKNL